MKKVIWLSMFLLLSCGNDKNSGSLKTTHKYLNEYLLTRDKKFLKKGYDELNRNVGFNEKGITDKNREIVIPLLMYLRKYDELEKLMINYKTIDINKKEISLNLIKSLKVNKKDKLLSKSYIDKNLKLIKEMILKNPKDSLLYGDYFVMKLYNSDKNTVLKQIDSMQKSNKVYSSEFYDLLLKDLINNYPKEFLY